MYRNNLPESPSKCLNTIETPTIDSESIDIPSSQPQTTQMDNPPKSHVTPHSIPVTSAVTKQGPTTIEDLPNELLVNIFNNLDTEAPSSSLSRLHDEPTLNITTSRNQDLKNCSLISKRWRQPILPLLFKYARYILKYSEDDARPILNDLIGPVLLFLHTQSLANLVETFTLVVRSGKISNHWDGIPQLCEFDSFWQRLFSTIDPPTILIAAPVEALASLTSAVINPGYIWQFNIECHYLQLQRDKTKDNIIMGRPRSPKSSTNRSDTPILTDTPFDEHLHYSRVRSHRFSQPLVYAKKSELFQIRPWRSLLLNEGSNLQAYKSSTWYELDTPSILRNLVGGGDIIPLIGPLIRTMKYIAIFPLTSHFEYLARNLPRLNHLYCQLVPRNDALEDEELKRKVEFDDLWMERNNCYAQLMREMFNNPPEGNYRFLRSFESGDAADKDAWEMAVEFVKRAGGAWKITGDGIFERDFEETDKSPGAGPGPGPLFVDD